MSEDHSDDGELMTSRSLVARSVTPAGRDGTVVTQLAAPVENHRTVTVIAELPGRRCTQPLPVADVDAAAPRMTCTPT